MVSIIYNSRQVLIHKIKSEYGLASFIGF